jgi:hypothetical protein
VIKLLWLAIRDIEDKRARDREDNLTGPAVACSEMVTSAAGRFCADDLAALVRADGWQRLGCADGSKGPRLHDWALIGTAAPPASYSPAGP